jgi:transposase InsO family protein
MEQLKLLHMGDDRRIQIDDEYALEIAAFRHRVIAEALEANTGEVQAAVQRAARIEYSPPRGLRCKPKVRTIWRWIAAYRKGGLFALCPKRRADRGTLRAFEPELLQRAVNLRREGEKDKRATKSIIDILVRLQSPEPLKIARSTLDRHFDKLGVSRRQLHVLGRRPFTRIETHAPFELVVADFHHGPYVRVGNHNEARRALLCAFIDHYSRYVPEGRYYLHEDFAALRFGFRRLLAGYGLAVKLYADNGASFQANRFHGACKHLGIALVHSKPYAAEARGVIERYNRTLKDQFESEVRERDELLTLDELNTYFQAWLSERYHRDVHSMTGQAPRQRFRENAVVRPAPDPAQVDELLRLCERRTVHRKWSTVEVDGIRYSVDQALRGRRVGVLYDPCAREYVLITFDGRVVQRAFPQKAGEVFPEPEPDNSENNPRTDYLELLRRDHERRSQAELAALRLAPAQKTSELALADLLRLLESCRGSRLTNDEKKNASAFWRKMRPILADDARQAIDAVLRRQGGNLHLSVYLDALNAHLIRMRTQKGKKS